MEGQYTQIFQQKIVDLQAAPLPHLTRRDIWLPSVPGKATAVIGMRRAGKSSLLWQILAERAASGTPREGLLYFSFEDERLAGIRLEHLNGLLETYYRLNPHWRTDHRSSLFLDEIQLVAGWEGFARRILDTENIELFISGSSARMLSREVASSMRGRAMEAVVTPFSFREALRHAGREPAKSPEHFTKADRSRLDNELYGYLQHGGFPEAQGLDQRNRMELLRTYVDVVLLRDVVERHNIAQPQVLRWMVQQLLGNPAGAFSINKFFTDLKSRGVAVGKDTLHRLLAHLEDAFLVHTVPIASDSPRRRQVNLRKVYPVDTALAALFTPSGKSSLGHALETIVLHELLRRGAEVNYVRVAGDVEVDFWVRMPDGRERLLQVCADLTAKTTLDRELRSLQAAATTWPSAEKILIALNIPAAIDLPEGIRLYRAVDWLLEQSGEET